MLDRVKYEKLLRNNCKWSSFGLVTKPAFKKEPNVLGKGSWK